MLISQSWSLAGKIKAIHPLVNQPIFSAYNVLSAVLANTFKFMGVLSLRI